MLFPNDHRSKRIFILPVLAVFVGVRILYPFFSRNFTDIYFAVTTAFSTHKLIIPDGFNFKYLILFSGLILMSLTDMLFERIHRFIPIFLMLAGVLFAYIANKPLINAFEALGVGLGLFIYINRYFKARFLRFRRYFDGRSYRGVRRNRKYNYYFDMRYNIRKGYNLFQRKIRRLVR